MAFLLLHNYTDFILCLFKAHAQNSINRTKIAKTTECPTVLSNPMKSPKAIAIPTIINEQT